MFFDVNLSKIEDIMDDSLDLKDPRFIQSYESTPRGPFQALRRFFFKLHEKFRREYSARCLVELDEYI